MTKTAILIGFGGMGRRYYQALKMMKIKVLAVCDKNIKKYSNYKFEKNISLVQNYKNLLNHKADLLCLASNTQSRLNILNDFCNHGKIKKILTEKPLSTSYKNCLDIKKTIKKNKIRLIVNTHRSYSPNFKAIKNIFKIRNENHHLFL